MVIYSQRLVLLMIEHYIILKAVYENDDKPVVVIDHALALDTFEGVAYNTDTQTWISSGRLTGRDANNDANFISRIAYLLSENDLLH